MLKRTELTLHGNGNRLRRRRERLEGRLRELELIKRLWRAGDMSTAEYLVQLKQAIDTQAAGIELRGRSWKSGFNWLYETAQITAWLDINIMGKN